MTSSSWLVAYGPLMLVGLTFFYILCAFFLVFRSKKHEAQFKFHIKNIRKISSPPG